ncbi:MAG: Ribosomal RNA-processing protein 7 [Cirrosporium novae-zelandiae]|nr:MAG: Ribosomal RNA-processing protein 7 [Cirrosporium novae-zelandiae]
MAPEMPLEVSGYIIVPITLPKLSSISTTANHYLYVRRHDPKLPDPDSSRSLFIANIPITVTETHLRHLFSTQLLAGRVERVDFPDVATKKSVSSSTAGAHKQGKKRKRMEPESIEAELENSSLPTVWDRELHSSGSAAIVVFVDRASMELSFKAAKKIGKRGTSVVWGEGIEEKLPALGSARYLAHHRLRYPDRSALLNSINDYMTAFSHLETARANALAQKRQEPDEDGFITVTRGGRNGPARQEEAREAAEKQKEKNKGLEDFYRFQIREKRKEKQGQLIKAFEEDRKKIDEMRKQRGRIRPE